MSQLGGNHSFTLLNGHPALTYDNQGELIFAWYDGNQWWFNTVDERSFNDVYSSLMIWDGQPLIAYSLNDFDLATDVVKFTTLEGFNSNGTFTYSPNPDFCGTDSFDYYANDGELDSNIATVTINVLCQEAPIANSDTYTVSEDVPLVIDSVAEGVLGNDTDSNGDELTAVLTLSPTLGTLDFNDNGTFTYTPNEDVCGTDSFNYYASDGMLNSDVTTATITVECVNKAPIAVPDMYTVTQGMTLTVDLASQGLLANDTDPEQDTLTVSGNSFPANGTLLSLNSDGTFAYTPNDGFCGVDSFTYTATDGELVSDETAVTINILCSPNSTPITQPDVYTVTQGITLTVDLASQGLLANDTDPEQDTLTVSGHSFPANGTLLSLNSDGTFAYMPNDGFCGVDSFTYTATDGELVSDETAVTINIICQPKESYTIYLPIIQK